jgi:hypothetical protein
VTEPPAPFAPRLSAQPAPQITGKTAADSFSGADLSQMGFPVPPPPPTSTVPEPTAVGGVRFQRFPDPRTGKETTVLPDMSNRAARPDSGDSVPAPRRAPGHRALEDEEDTITPLPGPDNEEQPQQHEDEMPGRHTVPEELVKAATYRLPPDRVFRAKVRDTTTSSDEPTTKLVPKPRQS